MSRRHLLGGLAVFLLALLPRLAYVEQNERELGLDVSRLDQTDNHTFATWARIIAAGDLLCRQQPHAFHHWTAEVAPEDRWVEWYGGEQVFHQAPLYPYAVAAVFRFLGDEHGLVALAQAVLGAVTCWLTFLLALRVLSFRGALLAGLMLAFMGSFYFYDAFILRDGPMAFLVVLLAYALQRAVDADRIGSWFVAGLTLGLFALAKETGPPLLALTLVGLGVWKRRTPRAAGVRVAVVLLGYLLLLSPAIARNVAVGAPPLKLSTRGPEVFVTGNALGQTGVGWNPPTDEMRRILMDSNASLSRAMLLTLATHRADPWGYVELLWGKTRAFFNGYEVPNNVDFYLHRAHLSTLRLGFVSMTFIAPACLLGLLLCFPRRRRMAVPYLMLVAIAGSVIALYILARFRLQALPLMVIFAAATVDWALTAWSERRRMALLAAGLLFMVFVSWCWWDADPFGERNKHSGIMLKLAKIGDFEHAMHYRDLLLDTLTPDSAEGDPNMVGKLRDLTGAFESFDKARGLAETDPQRHILLGEGYSQIQSITKRGDLRDFHDLALRHFNRALDLDPDVVGAEHGIGVALSRLATHPAENDGPPDLGPALSHFIRELRRHPEHGESHRDAGHIRYAWGDYPAALEHFLRAERAGVAGGPELACIAFISINPAGAGQAVTLGDETFPVHDAERGWAYGERALALSPDDPAVLDKLATVLFSQSRHDESIALLEKLITLQPWRTKELRNRIESFRLGQRNQAAKAAAKAAAADQAQADDLDGTTPAPGLPDTPDAAADADSPDEVLEPSNGDVQGGHP